MTKIDTHDAFYKRNKLSEFTEALFRTKREISFRNNKLDILSKEYLLVYLSLHFFHHNYKGIERLRLIDTIIRKDMESKDYWMNIILIINNYNFENFSYITFFLLKKYFNTPIPQSIFKNIIPRSAIIRSYIHKISQDTILNDENSSTACVRRFILLLLLSPQPLLKKITVFFHKSTIIYIYIVVFAVIQSIIFSKRRIIRRA